MPTALDREADSSSVDPQDLLQLQHALEDRDRPRLVGREGFEIELPDPIFHHLLRIVRAMRQGQKVFLMPENEEMTTQAAANFLGVSRPFLVKLLEGGKIPFRYAGSHRRVTFRDLKAYSDRRDQERRARLDELFTGIEEDGLYDVPDDFALEPGDAER